MLDKYEIIDLTHPLTPEMPTWTGGCGFAQEIKLDYESTKEELGFRVQQLKMHAGIGTHMDAPSHCIPNAASIADLPLAALCVAARIIDISHEVNEHSLLMPADIDSFEAKHGIIPPHSFVIVYTGWDKRWHHPNAYRNDHSFPSISQQATELLLLRNIAGLGIDTLSPDRPGSDFPVHRLVLGQGKYLIENVANAGQLPPVGCYTFALPIKTVGGTEAPTRLIALKPKSGI